MLQEKFQLITPEIRGFLVCFLEFMDILSQSKALIRAPGQSETCIRAYGQSKARIRAYGQPKACILACGQSERRIFLSSPFFYLFVPQAKTSDFPLTILNFKKLKITKYFSKSSFKLIWYCCSTSAFGNEESSSLSVTGFRSASFFIFSTCSERVADMRKDCCVPGR